MKGVIMKSKWILCPICGNKTRLQIRADTQLKNYPLYCPKCKQESLIDAKDLQVTVISGNKVKEWNRLVKRQISVYGLEEQSEKVFSTT